MTFYKAKKYLLLILIIVIIPIDFLLWNILMGKKYGYINFNRCVSDNLKELNR